MKLRKKIMKLKEKRRAELEKKMETSTLKPLDLSPCIA
jgi:hypothetical protein